MRLMKYCLAVVIAAAGAALMAATIETVTLTNIRQINDDGFGAEANKYAFSMAVYRDALYVGTLNIKKMPGMFRFLTGTTAKRATHGAEVWRYDKDGTWTRLVDKGLKSRYNLGVRKMAVAKGCLYGVTANHDEGMEVWRTCDGDNWEVVADRGFGDGNNTSGRGLAEFNGFIYAGTENRSKGAQLWRSKDGENWECVADEGIRDPGNWWVSDFAELDGRLYMGTLNIRGFQLFRTRDGKEFEQLLSGGAEKFTNTGGMKLIVFKDKLYVSTMDFFRGFDLYASGDGVNFQRILEKGHTGGHNAYLWQMKVYNGRLYAGTYHHKLPLPSGAFELYSTGDGVEWIMENVPEPGSGKSKKSWRKKSSENQEPRYSWPDPYYYGVRSMAVFDNKLIIGTASPRYGCRVYEAAGK
jgi:hypothetical protein